MPSPSFLFFLFFLCLELLQLTLTTTLSLVKRGEDNVINHLLFSISFGGGGGSTVYCDGKGKYLLCRLSLSLSFFGRHFLFSLLGFMFY